MDILSHGLWAGLALAALKTRAQPTRGIVSATIALAVLPDLLQLLPVAFDALFRGQGWALLWQYATALPGQEPLLSPPKASLAHHLHCVAHSALVAGVLTAAIGFWTGRFWWPLLGWWMHILIDVFTHSAEFFPSPVFYPLTYWGFDGIAWNTPWFMVLNYAALTVCAVWLWRRRSRGPGRH